jgi:hypothetical protein
MISRQVENFIHERKIYLLEQLNPFPEYPALHPQTKEPSLSVHVALCWHGLLEHSLLSKKITQITNNMWLEELYKVLDIGMNDLLTRTRFTY